MPFSLSGQDSQVSWAYDWFYAPCSAAGVQSCGFNPALEFVPLLYNDDPNLLSQWPAAAQLAIDNGSTALFSFNEPDFCQSGSACMNVSTAVYYHQQYMQPFAGKALIGAPAVTNSGGTDADPMGLQYLQYFLGNCTGCTIDFINLHWYSNKYAGASYLEYYVNSARAVAAGRPIWITEFGLDSTYSYTDAELQAFLQEAMPWLDQQPDVARYAYFMDTPGILIDSAGDGISGTGMVYNNFTNSTLQPNLYTS
ncbi:glycoside hydrolase family 128 protein, partial [Aureobasidium melanogenum]